jgi:hypothetical protein
MDALADPGAGLCKTAILHFMSEQQFAIQAAFRCSEFRMTSLDDLAKYPDYHESRVMVLQVV